MAFRGSKARWGRRMSKASKSSQYTAKMVCTCHKGAPVSPREVQVT